jgi:hypothetical protein
MLPPREHPVHPGKVANGPLATPVRVLPRNQSHVAARSHPKKVRAPEISEVRAKTVAD